MTRPSSLDAGSPEVPVTVASVRPIGLVIESRDRYRWGALGSLALLAIAGGMAAFGLPPMDLHGPLHWFGIMDPLCGGTRAARYTALGQWGLAWKYNPLDLVTVLAVTVMVARALVGVVARRWIAFDIR